MKTLFAFATITAILTTLGLSTQVVSQTPNPAGANAGKFGVAVVDVGYIFKNHQTFKGKMEGMKTEMAGIEESLKTKREQIAKLEATKEQYELGSEEYKQIDENVAREKANFNLEMNRLRKDFLEREAKVYYETFIQVDKAVAYYAQRQNIGLVLRFNGESPDPNRREEILRAINKPIVYQNSIDITPDVLSLLNRNGQPREARQAVPGSQIPGQQR